MGMVGCFCAVTVSDLTRLRGDPDLIEDYLYPDDGDSDPPYYIDVDKAWHGIHYLLTGLDEGGAEPLSLAVLGGEEFGEEMGYGPARFLTSEQVKQVARALTHIDIETLSKRYQPIDMKAKDIYPDIWERDNQQALDYLLDNFQQLVVFYRDTAQRGDAALLWLS